MRSFALRAWPTLLPDALPSLTPLRSPCSLLRNIFGAIFPFFGTVMVRALSPLCLARLSWWGVRCWSRALTPRLLSRAQYDHLTFPIASTVVGGIASACTSRPVPFLSCV